MATSEIDRELHTQVLKREAVKESAYREERARLEEEFHNSLGLGGTEMSKQELRKIVDADRRMYYRTEELNDKLYIHYKGWRDLKNLEGWTGLKTLYAESNAFSQIAGLQNCTKLRSLFLQENCISKISGLEALTDLWSLNLSSNFIERIEGLENCKGLNTLIIAKNKIGFGGVADVERLADTNLCTLDIQDNKIDDPDVLPEVFMRMPGLRVLYLKGNSAAKKIVNYRKSITVYCKDLRYLDDRPVFEDDRRTAEAFNRGGLEEQRAEQKRIREEKSQKHENNMRAFQEMIDNSKREKRERDAMRREDKYTDETDPVESWERRCKRLQAQWKEDNKDDLKDDAQEYAEKCLAAEREGRQAPPMTSGDVVGLVEEADQQQKATAESRDTAAESGDTGAVESADTGAVAKGEKVDNRKLVYEDIWDDQPSGAQPAASEKQVDNRKLVYDDIWDDVPAASVPSTSTTASPAGPPKAYAPRAQAEPRSKTVETADSEESGDSKPSWHSKYRDQVAKTQAKLQAAAPGNATAFKPPPRRPEPAAPVSQEAPAGKPESKVGEASPPQGAGELDEMD